MKRFLFGDLKSPIYKDWIFYLFIFAFSVNASKSPLGSLVAAFIFFLWIPSKVRAGVARKKEVSGPGMSWQEKRQELAAKASEPKSASNPGYKIGAFRSARNTFLLNCSHTIYGGGIGSSSTGVNSAVWCDVCKAERNITRQLGTGEK